MKFHIQIWMVLIWSWSILRNYFLFRPKPNSSGAIRPTASFRQRRIPWNRSWPPPPSAGARSSRRTLSADPSRACARSSTRHSREQTPSAGWSNAARAASSSASSRPTRRPTEPRTALQSSASCPGPWSTLPDLQPRVWPWWGPPTSTTTCSLTRPQKWRATWSTSSNRFGASVRPLDSFKRATFKKFSKGCPGQLYLECS